MQPLHREVVIIARRPDTYWGEDRKVFYEKTLEAVKQLGFGIVDPDEILDVSAGIQKMMNALLKMPKTEKFIVVFHFWTLFSRI